MKDQFLRKFDDHDIIGGGKIARFEDFILLIFQKIANNSSSSAVTSK